MLTRIITAGFLIAFIVLVLFVMPYLFESVVAITLGIGMWEWCRIAKISQKNSYLLIISTLLLWAAASYSAIVFYVLLALTLINYVFAFLLIVQYETRENFVIRKAYLRISGPIILSALASALIYIFNSDHFEGSEEDGAIVLFILLVIAAADSGAYFVGRFFGKHKLAPKTSPKKTVEGLIGGLLCAGLTSLLLQFMVDPWYLTAPQLIFISLVSAAFSVIGDLFISIIKRQNNIKDTSNILPGHGGILDRIDGLLAGVPIFYFLQLLI